MAGYEVGVIDVVSRANGAVTEAEVRAGEASRLTRVVLEVSLAILIGILTDDLDRVLIRTHGTVRSTAVELRLKGIRSHVEVVSERE